MACASRLKKHQLLHQKNKRPKIVMSAGGDQPDELFDIIRLATLPGRTGQSQCGQDGSSMTLTPEQLAAMSPEQIEAFARGSKAGETNAPPIVKMAPEDAGQCLGVDGVIKDRVLTLKIPLGEGFGYARANRQGIIDKRTIAAVGGGRDAKAIGQHPVTGNVLKLRVWLGEYLPIIDQIKFDAKSMAAKPTPPMDDWAK